MASPRRNRNPMMWGEDYGLELDPDVLPPCHYLQLQPPSPSIMPWQPTPVVHYPVTNHITRPLLPNQSHRLQGDLNPPITKPTPTYAISRHYLNEEALQQSCYFFRLLGFLSLLCGIVTLIASLNAEAMNLSIHAISMLIVAVYSSYMLVMLKICQAKASRITTFRRNNIDLFHCLLFIMFLCFLLGGLFFGSITNLVRGSQVSSDHLGRIIATVISMLYAICLALAYVLVLKFHLNTESELSIGFNKLLKQPIRYRLYRMKEMGILLKRNMIHIHPGSRKSLFIAFLVQSTVACAANLAIVLIENSQRYDGVLSILFIIFPIFSVANFLQDVLKNLTEGVLKGIDFGEIAESLLSVSGVLAVRQLRIWSISMDKISLSAHLAIDRNRDSNSVLSDVAHLLKSNYDIYAYDLEDDIQKQPPPFKIRQTMKRPASWLWFVFDFFTVSP